ncbi:hypothetical protein R4172_18865 [Rhodococcus kroppenstedtii]|uniref:hypothetical protein n=1 Tax=Rhodococcoides kroppenstedtii TaxID=293050 RepID=UPI0029554677|nr:hypothetical protein [Rhodococcus kroppenstedtii]MDV7199608.1 hypothetical protein [Rhodococcus kroppenstedtii]
MAASGSPSFSWRSDVIGPVIAIVAVLGTIALGFFTAFWAGRFAPDLAAGYAVPSSLRRGVDLPPPPTSYWVIWAAPPLTVTALGGATMTIAGRTRWFALLGTLMFLVGYLPFALTIVLFDLGGFSPG